MINNAIHSSRVTLYRSSVIIAAIWGGLGAGYFVEMGSRGGLCQIRVRGHSYCNHYTHTLYKQGWNTAMPVSTSCWTLAVSPSSENQSMLCSMSYYPRLLPTHLLIMDPYSPKIAHKIYKCDNKTNIEELFLPLQSERTLMIRKKVDYVSVWQ